MQKKEFETYLKNECPWIDQNTFDQFEIYKQTLQYHNKLTNLTRLADDELIYDQYFLSSLLPFAKLNYFHSFENSLKVLDIGTGSGIPGIVLKLIYPNIKLTLIEANGKKCNFLKLLLEKLNLVDVVLINDRCENCSQQYCEQFDVVTSRAVSSLNKILELSAQFTKINGNIIALKSNNYLNEVNEAKNAIEILNLALQDEIQYQFGGHNYVVLDYKKNKSTDKKYPRSWNKIVNNPL